MLGHCRSKAIPIFEIKYLALMLHSIKQEASLTHPAFNFRNKDGRHTLYQRIPLSNCEPIPEHWWYPLPHSMVSIEGELS